MNQQYVRMMMSARMSATDVADINIYGYITSYKWGDDDVTAMEIKKELEKVNDAKTLKVHINSPGGSVYQGLSMMDNLKAHGAATKEAYIEGLCASAATLPLMAMDKVFMYEGSELMFHNPASGSWGTSKDLKKASDELLLTQQNVCKLYSAFCQKDESEVQADMDDEKWLDAETAVTYGFVDEVIKIVEDKQSASMLAPTISRGQMMMLGYQKVPEDLMGRLPEKEPEQKPGESAAQTVVLHTNNHEEETCMTLEELRAQHPEMVAAIETAAMEAGVQKERKRIKGLEEMAMPGYETLLSDAKFEKPIDAAELSVNIIKDMRSKGGKYMTSRQEETKHMQEVPGGDGAEEMTEDQEATMEAKRIAAAYGVKNPGKE